MRVGIHKDSSQELREVYNPITLVTNSGETLSIAMRDSGFEFTYQGQLFEAKEGSVKPLSCKKTKDIDVVEPQEVKGYVVTLVYEEAKDVMVRIKGDTHLLEAEFDSEADAEEAMPTLLEYYRSL